jgi:hypothetical protein
MTLALSINPHHSSYGLLKEGRACSVNVLKTRALFPHARPAPITFDIMGHARSK